MAVTRWKKGESGNPAGRKPGTGMIKTDIKELGRTMTHDVMHKLYDIVMSDKHRAADRVAAAAQILDRGWGKPSQHIDIVAQELQVLGGLSYADVRELVPTAIALLQEAEKEETNE